MNTKFVSDKVLIKRFIQGDHKSFEILLQRYEKKIFTNIYFKVRNRKLSEDIFQDVCIKVINSLRTGKYNEEGKFLQWVTQISNNFIIDYLRKENSLRSQCWVNDDIDRFEYINSNERNALEKMIQDQSSRYIKILIDKLPDEQKEIVILRHYKRYSFKEIAEKTDVNINTALGRMRYAIANLRRMLKNANIEL